VDVLHMQGRGLIVAMLLAVVVGLGAPSPGSITDPAAERLSGPVDAPDRLRFLIARTARRGNS